MSKFDIFFVNWHVNEIVSNEIAVSAFLAHQRDPAIAHQVEQLKSCISILFSFQRKPTKDDVFTKDTRQWLAVLVRKRRRRVSF